MILIFALLPLDIIATKSDSFPSNSSSISSSVLTSNPSIPSILILFLIPSLSFSIIILTSISFPSASIIFLFILIFISPFSISTLLSIFTLLPSFARNSILVSSLTLIFLSKELPELSSSLSDELPELSSSLALPELPESSFSSAKTLVGLSANPSIRNDRNISKNPFFISKLTCNMFLKLVILNLLHYFY